MKKGNHDKACVKYLVEDSVNKRVILDLAETTDCTTAYQLLHTYKTNHDGSDPDPHKDVWDFTSGKSAGECVDDNQFYKADPTDLAQPFSDVHCKNVSFK